MELEEILGEDMVENKISDVEKEDILFQNKEIVIAALLATLILTTYYFIPLLGIVIVVGTFVKYT